MQNELKEGRRRQTVLVLARRMYRRRMGQSQWREEGSKGPKTTTASNYAGKCDDICEYM